MRLPEKYEKSWGPALIPGTAAVLLAALALAGSGEKTAQPAIGIEAETDAIPGIEDRPPIAEQTNNSFTVTLNKEGDTIWGELEEHADKNDYSIPADKMNDLVDGALNQIPMTWEEATDLPVNYSHTFGSEKEVFGDYMPENNKPEITSGPSSQPEQPNDPQTDTDQLLDPNTIGLWLKLNQ